ADQDQGVGPGITGFWKPSREWRQRYGQLAVDVLEISVGRCVIGHPDEHVGRKPRLGAEAGQRPALCDVIANLVSQFRQEPALTTQEYGPSPGAESRDDVLRSQLLEPAQGRNPAVRIAVLKGSARAVDDQRAGEKHAPGRQVDGRAGRA